LHIKHLQECILHTGEYGTGTPPSSSSSISLGVFTRHTEDSNEHNLESSSSEQQLHFVLFFGHFFTCYTKGHFYFYYFQLLDLNLKDPDHNGSSQEQTLQESTAALLGLLVRMTSLAGLVDHTGGAAALWAASVLGRLLCVPGLLPEPARRITALRGGEVQRLEHLICTRERHTRVCR
jgi:hypothetical protein